MLTRFIAILAALHVVAFAVLAFVLQTPHLWIGTIIMALVAGVALLVGKGASRRRKDAGR